MGVSTFQARDFAGAAYSTEVFRAAYGRSPRWALLEAEHLGMISRWTYREDVLRTLDNVHGFVDSIDEALAWKNAVPSLPQSSRSLELPVETHGR